MTTILNDRQVALLDRISIDDFLTRTFYFTGGTALSEVYLQHRESVDLDFFSHDPYDSQNIVARLNQCSAELQYVIESDFVDPVHIYFLKFTDGTKLKIDFAHYPYTQLESPQKFQNKLMVDSLHDIAANKLLALTQRVEVKDFVDMYFLLQKFTFWELRDSVKSKFNVDIDPFIFASDCMLTDGFEFMPKMLQPLELSDLKKYFRDLAKQLGKESFA